MTRRYGHPIQVEPFHDADGDSRLTFTWRGRQRATQIIGSWRLDANWWDETSATNRIYYRVQTANLAVYDLYHDRTRDLWVLDVCFD